MIAMRVQSVPSGAPQNPVYRFRVAFLAVCKNSWEIRDEDHGAEFFIEMRQFSKFLRLSVPPVLFHRMLGSGLIPISGKICINFSLFIGSTVYFK
jgi:hypothetical protein